VFFASSCTLAKVADSSAVDADGELCFMTHKSLIQLVEPMAASVVFTTLVSLKTITSTMQLNIWACIHKTYSSPYDRCMSCLSVLSVTLVYCGQTVGWIKIKLGTQVGLGPGHIVLDGDPAPPPPKWGGAPQFLAQICCGQMAGWINMPLGRVVGLSPSDILLDRDAAPHPTKGGEAPQFSAHVYCG